MSKEIMTKKRKRELPRKGLNGFLARFYNYGYKKADMLEWLSSSGASVVELGNQSLPVIYCGNIELCNRLLDEKIGR